MAGAGSTTTTNSAFWTGTYDMNTSTSHMNMVQRRDTSVVPGTAGANWNTDLNLSVSQFQVNNAGQVAFNANVINGDTITAAGQTQNTTAVFIGGHTGVRMVSRAADFATWTGDNLVRVDTFGFPGLQLNGGGDVVVGMKYRAGSCTGGSVVAGVFGNNTIQGNNQAIVEFSANGNVKEIARWGNQAAGLASGIIYHNATSQGSSPFNLYTGTGNSINNSGNVFFSTAIAGAGVTSGLDDQAAYIYKKATNTVQLIARKNDDASALYGAGVNFGALGSATRYNNNDTILAAEALQGINVITDNTSTSRNNEALVAMFSDGSKYHVVRMNQNVSSASSTFASDVAISTLSSLISSPTNGLNNLDQVIFIASLKGTGIYDFTNATQQNDQALFFWSRTGGLELICQTGTFGTAELGSAATSLRIDVRCSGEGGGTAFSDTGWVAFSAVDRFGHQGIYRVHVPTPGSLSLLGLGAAAAFRRRR
jgi:hypothetical protein